MCNTLEVPLTKLYPTISEAYIIVSINQMSLWEGVDEPVCLESTHNTDSTVQYSTVQYSTVQYSTVQYSTVSLKKRQNKTKHHH